LLLLQLLLPVQLQLLLQLLLPPPLLLKFLLSPLLRQTLLLLVLLLLLFVNGMEPNGPWRPPHNLGGLDALVRDAIARQTWAVPGFITNSDWVALSPQLGRLGGSLLTFGASRFTLTRGR